MPAPSRARALILVWLCFLARGLFYSHALPLWEGFDEFSHFAVVQHLRHHGALPVPNVDRMSFEVNSSLRAYPVPWTLRDLHPDLLTYEKFATLSTEQRAARQAVLNASPEPDPSAETIYESQQPPLYYALLAPALALGDALNWPLPKRVFLLRALSVLLASLCLPFGFLLGRRLLGPDAALGLCATVTLMPGLFIDIARVGNDSLALLLYSALAWLLYKAFDRDLSWPGTLALGLTLGAGLLTKSYFLTAVPAILAVCLYRRLWRAALAVPVLAALVSGWWYVWIFHHTGDLTGQIQSANLKAIPLGQKLSTALHMNWLQALDTALFSHIWFGAWSFLQLRGWMYHVFYAVFALAALGLLVAAFRRRLFDLAPLLLLEACFCASLAYHALLGQLGYGLPMTNGWYLYCLIFAQTLLLRHGLAQFLPGAWPLRLLAVLFALLDLYAFNLIQLPYYLGVMQHTPAGRLPSIRPDQLSVLAGRLSPAWVVYLAATLAPIRCAARGADEGPLR